MWANLQFFVDFFIFTEEILIGKNLFFFSVLFQYILKIFVIVQQKIVSISDF